MLAGEFKVMYDALEDTSHQTMGKIIFLCYMVIVTLLLINMLIAMMGNTYTLVNETQKEWLRQWAHIVLAIEQSVTPGNSSPLTYFLFLLAPVLSKMKCCSK